MIFRSICSVVVCALAAPNIAVAGTQASHDLLALKRLPTKPAVRAKSDVRYEFTTDYYQFNAGGSFQSKRQIKARYTEELSGAARWNGVSSANASSLKGDFSAPTAEPLMEGFTYPLGSVADSFKPGFFKKIEGNTELMTQVWDVGQIELFGLSYLGSLELNKQFYPSLPDSALPGGGSFRNERVEITWVGIAKVDGQECAQISYEAPYNPITLVANGMKLNGLSYYHGLISVNLKDLRVQQGTIHETVVMSVVPPGFPANSQPIVSQTVRDCLLKRVR